ncbi:hypothetical protein ACH46Q_11360 [Micrococcus luteus]|uniref:hypothetical protein n=1 Tax=Micrococcus luteus TaxID=1270 RepID=UPI00379B360A
MSSRVHFPENDPLEIEATQRIMEMLRYTHRLTGALDDHRNPAAGSAYERDRGLCPAYPSSVTVDHLLSAAHGNLAAMRRTLAVEESDTKVNMTLDLYGVYELVRGTLETSARALWVASPGNARRRAKRTLLLLKEENDNKIKYLEAMGKRTAEVRELQAEMAARLRGYAALADIDPWPGKGARRGDIWADHPVKSTRILQYVSHFHQAPNLPLGYYAAWCMASGIAHGQQWAFHLLNERREMNWEAMEAQMTGSFQRLHLLMQSAVALVSVAADRHIALSTQPSPGPVQVRALIDLKSPAPSGLR